MDVFLGGVTLCVQRLAWLAPQALAAFPPENILVSVSPSMMSFLGNVQGPSGWRGPMQVGEKAGRARNRRVRDNCHLASSDPETHLVCCPTWSDNSGL